MRSNHASDYRRCFIMLRALQPGWNGHARLEKRAVSAGLAFTVAVPAGDPPPRALLAGTVNGETALHPLGELRRDPRGQYRLAAQLDPRGIDGRPLEAWPWIAVTRGDEIALIGSSDASRPADLDALRRALAAARSGEPAADLPEPEEEAQEEAPFAVFPGDGPEPEAVSEAPVIELPPPEALIAPEPSGEAPAAPEAPAREEPPDDVKIYTGSRLRLFTQSPPTPEKNTPPAPDRTAADALGLDITRPWPGAAEELRHLFALLPPASPPLADGYTYVAVPRAAGCGYGRCFAGLQAQNGTVSGLRRAVEGRWSPQPPAGLEDYQWKEGHWVKDEPTGFFRQSPSAARPLMAPTSNN